VTAVTRLVLVGAGQMGRAWIQAIDRSVDTRLVGLVDLDRGVAEDALAQRDGQEPVMVGDDVVRTAQETGAEAVVNVTVPRSLLNYGWLGAALAAIGRLRVSGTGRGPEDRSWALDVLTGPGLPEGRRWPLLGGWGPARGERFR